MKRNSNRARWLWPALLLLAGSPAVWAQAAGSDAATLAQGKRLFMRCAACHDATNTGSPKIGPHLQGLVGRQALAVTGYAYSPGMKAKPSLVWDAATIDAWLIKPSDVVPGTTMAFVGMPDARERKALLMYLQSLK